MAIHRIPIVEPTIITIDEALSSISKNPVENKAITLVLNSLSDHVNILTEWQNVTGSALSEEVELLTEWKNINGKNLLDFVQKYETVIETLVVDVKTNKENIQQNEESIHRLENNAETITEKVNALTDTVEKAVSDIENINNSLDGLEVEYYISILQQPSNATAYIEEYASFTVGANSEKSISYQWQVRKPSDATWQNITNDTAMTNSLTFTHNIAEILQIRCKIYNSVSEVYTDVATFEVIPEIVITKQPQNISADGGDTFQLSTAATGKNGISYLWQTSHDGGTTWSTAGSVGATGKTANYTGVMDYTAIEGDTFLYRCQLTVGNTIVYTDVATVTCSKTLTIAITKQPVAQNIILGDSVTFTIETDREQDDVSYAWSRLNKDGTMWMPCGSTQTITLTPTSTWGAPVKVKCRVMIQGTNILADSNEAIITITDPAISITEQPVSPGTVYTGETYSASVTANSALPLSYQWQIKEPGTDNWINSTNSTATTNNFTSNQITNYGDYMVRCKISNSKTTVYTDEITIPHVNSTITITTQPGNTLSVETGDTISLSVAANSVMTLSYQWQKSTDGSTFTDISGATSSVLSISAPSSAITEYYRCKISNSKKELYSNVCTVSVKEPISYSIDLKMDAFGSPNRVFYAEVSPPLPDSSSILFETSSSSDSGFYQIGSIIVGNGSSFQQSLIYNPYNYYRVKSIVNNKEYYSSVYKATEIPYKS